MPVHCEQGGALAELALLCSLAPQRVFIMPKLTAKQEKFALYIFQDIPQREAWGRAGYSTNMLPSTIDSNASRLAASSKILARLVELRKKSEDEAISTVNERRKILTQIERATISDYVDEVGNLDISDREILNTPAVQEIKTEKTLRGIRTTLKLRDPISAITEHNRMEKVGSDSNAGNTLNVNVNQLEAKVINFDESKVARAIIEAIRLGLNPAVLGGDGHGKDASLLPTSADIQATIIPESNN